MAEVMTVSLRLALVCLIATPALARTLATGSQHACAVNVGEVWCWGNNGFGQLGDGTTREAAVPVRVQGIPGKTVAVAAGEAHSCALLESNDIYCWGQNTIGQLGGSGRPSHSSPPVLVNIKLTKSPRDFFARGSTTCVLDGNHPRCWPAYGLEDLPHQLLELALVNTTGPKGYCSRSARNEIVCNKNAFGNLKIAPKAKPINISSSNSHFCVVFEGGSVQCLGRNDYGQLGNISEGSTFENNFDPKLKVGREFVSVRDLKSPALSVVTGNNFTCASLEDGSVSCWGNTEGASEPFPNLQSGKKNWAGHGPRPVLVADRKPLTNVAEISAGDDFVCARQKDTNAAVYCWGSNHTSQLGLAAENIVALPFDVTFIVASRVETCAIGAPGKIQCWGRRDTPERIVSNLKGIRALAFSFGYNLFCAISGKTLQCQGDQPGASLKTFAEPKEPLALKSSSSFACATNQRGLWCWGDQPEGESEINSALGAEKPTLKLEGPIDDFAVSEFHMCAIQKSHAFCWGSNERGSLGDGTTKNRNRPTRVTIVSEPLRAIAIKHDVTCVITKGGKAKCWGPVKGPKNSAKLDLAPGVFELPGTDEFIQIDARDGSLCFLSKAGAVRCWGMDANGNSFRDTFPAEPPLISDLNTGVVRIAVGGEHVCGLISRNHVRCVGGNRFGQSGGDKLFLRQATPVRFAR